MEYLKLILPVYIWVLYVSLLLAILYFIYFVKFSAKVRPHRLIIWRVFNVLVAGIIFKVSATYLDSLTSVGRIFTLIALSLVAVIGFEAGIRFVVYIHNKVKLVNFLFINGWNYLVGAGVIAIFLWQLYRRLSLGVLGMLWVNLVSFEGLHLLAEYFLFGILFVIFAVVLRYFKIRYREYGHRLLFTVTSLVFGVSVFFYVLLHTFDTFFLYKTLYRQHVVFIQEGNNITADKVPDYFASLATRSKADYTLFGRHPLTQALYSLVYLVTWISFLVSLIGLRHLTISSVNTD